MLFAPTSAYNLQDRPMTPGLTLGTDAILTATQPNYLSPPLSEEKCSVECQDELNCPRARTKHPMLFALPYVDDRLVASSTLSNIASRRLNFKPE
ncbi:hypothetical protein H9L39_04442 [Fusarium oxysporum f. sp. albedinis]|nr:hypothetical protein H9L39_04442 [Fusarium oxysporum f. sp. albedinis]